MTTALAIARPEIGFECPPLERRLRMIHAEFARRLEVPCVIAGGAVRDMLRGCEPKDYDVFLLNDLWPAQGWDVSLEKTEQGTQADDYGVRPLGTYRFDGALVQVIQTKARTLHELLWLFDWNICMFGYDAAIGVVSIGSIDAIGPGKVLKLNRITYPVSTLRRGFRFSERFGMAIEPRELVELCVRSAAKLLEWGA